MTPTTPPALPEDAKLKSRSSVPSKKIVFGGMGGGITTILVFVLNSYVLPKGQPITPEIAAAIATVIAALVAYRVRPGPGDQVVVDTE